MASNKDHDRYSLESLEKHTNPDKEGRLFFSTAGAFDLNSVDIIHSGVDTIRQLYRGTMKSGLFEWLEMNHSQKSEIVEIFGQNWSFGRMGKNSGFRYRIQNNDLGIIMLIGSYYAEIKETGAHLKIELSPKFILQHETNEIQDYLDMISDWIYGEKKGKASGVAVHLACDVQGWEPKNDFRENFRTRSRSIQDINTISSVEFKTINEITVEYGKNQGFLFGKSSALQMALYRKDDEIIKTDKVDFWHDRWSKHKSGIFDKEKPVWRVEARVHHNIVREIGIGQGITIENFSQVVKFLGDIWKYALTSNRLQMSRQYIDPFWQLIRTDADFYNPAQNIVVVRKKKEDSEGVGRNYAQIIGNIITVGARANWKITQVMKQLKRLEFYDDILSYYRSRGLRESDLRQRLSKALCLRRLSGKAA